MPFAMYERQLREQLGLTVANVPTQSPQDRTRAIDDAMASPTPPTHVLVMPHWSEDPDQLAQWFAQTRNQLRGQTGDQIGDAKLIMLDYYAPTCSPHFGVLPHVDRYIKRQTLRDMDAYHTHYRSGFVFADFVADTWGFDLGDWSFGSALPSEHAHKIVTGWSLGLTPRYRQLLRLTDALPVPWTLRRIDVHQRVGGLPKPGKKQEWYQFSRAKGVEALAPLAPKHRLSTTGRVSRKKYFLELLTSKIVFSPFGWGEVCFRDYEAVVCGALLVKPDMAHLRTEPDIYVPHETYVPIAWDYHDAADVIDELLSDPKRCKRIIANARAAWRDYDQNHRFLDKCRDALQI